MTDTAQKNETEAFFNTLKEMEQHRATCTDKANFIEKVLSGKELVTFVVIDRCREVVLQSNQSYHVIKSLQTKLTNSTCLTEHAARLDEIVNTAEAINDRANKSLEIIVAWVPSAVNTRNLGITR